MQQRYRIHNRIGLRLRSVNNRVEKQPHAVPVLIVNIGNILLRESALGSKCAMYAFLIGDLSLVLGYLVRGACWLRFPRREVARRQIPVPPVCGQSSWGKAPARPLAGRRSASAGGGRGRARGGHCCAGWCR